MLVCRARPRRFAALSFLGASPARTTTSSSPASASTSQPGDKDQDSIFTSPESPWDHVFADIDPNPPPTQRLRTRLSDNHPASTYRKPGPSQQVMQRSSGIRHRRASITAREMSVFDEMFDMIFNAVSAQKGKGPPALGATSESAREAGSSDALPSLSGPAPSIGHAGGAPFNDLFRTLRRRTSRVRWTTAIDEELDRKKETMELLNTDYDLLEWVRKELFEDAQQWDEEAKKAMAAGKGKDTAASSSSSSSSSSPSGLGTGPGKHSIYPHLIAQAMRIFRTTYSNPSLSLAVFNHAARMSIPSYVFGCTAPAYNELMEAKWEGWGDLEGVCRALEEMRANGVKMDGRSRIVAERVRREVGKARPVEPKPEDVDPLARRVWDELGEGEVMRLLDRIERLALRDHTRKSMMASPHEESWKSAVLQSGEDDGWRFDGWEREGSSHSRSVERDSFPLISHDIT